MERDQRFSFKLLVPPRVNNGPISAVQPQEIVEDRGNFMKAFYSECFDKEKNILFPNTNMVAPTKPPKQGICVSLCYLTTPNNCNPGQLYSKLFDEVEKIKCWKVKVYSDTVEKERRLQDNKRTIETQRKAIQELQFGNESLSIKLEEQISENEELRNKNNSTWNLCNILKETFDSSVEKIHLFEAEREETHHLLTENNESVKKMIAAFEILRVRVETDQQEMQKVKEDLLQFDHLQKKYQQEFKIKQEEITMLQLKLKDKETQLQKLLLDLDETQKHCNELQQSTNHQFEVLKSAKAEQESLLQQLNIAEQRCRETEVSILRFFSFKDLSLQELNRVKNQQAEELECIQSTIQELKTSLALEKERYIKLLHSQCFLDKVQCFLMSLYSCFYFSEGKQYEIKFKAQEEYKKEVCNDHETLAIKGVEWYLLSSLVYFQNKMLKKQMAQEIAKSSDLETTISSLQNESQNLKQLKGEEHEKLLKALESKSTFAAELEKEVQKLRITAAEAIKNKEATELKCQHKIGDMVTLMEKHKSQYDRMVQEKDAELEEKKKNEMEATAREKSLELDLSKHKSENERLKKELKAETREKVYPTLNQFISEDMKTPRSLTNHIAGTTKIKSYRIRTPPSEQSAQWGKSAIELDPKSDSSDQNDLLVNSQCKLHILKKNQSPLIHKSPGNSLKLAAMKRMRDAGWTAVTGCDKKKKKTNEKIFA
uniref:Synaptonemal complex protein 1 n=1 Tax=Maylandia zebra TaxID=106582 RepID=A0A3P9B3P3_9CICH